MSPPGEGSTDPSSGVLRAVGSLLVALSGGDEAAAQRVLQNMQQRAEAPDSGFGAPRSYDPLPPLPRAVSQEVEFVLSDARQRAQRILDESMERARDLMRREQRYEARRYDGDVPPTPAIDPAAFDDLRRAIHGLVTEVRDIQQRLARIESLLVQGRNPEPERPREVPRPQQPETRYEPARYTPPAYQPPPQQPSPQQQAPAPERYEPPRREPEYQAPAWYEPPSPDPSPPPADAPPGRRRGERDWVPPHAHEDMPGSAVPPSREAAWQHERDAYGEPYDDRAPAAGSQAPIVTFLPEDGGVLLRITPLAGFQGLMRVQDALTRMDAVRHAAVEAYSQGEARLRLELQEATDSEELAAGLASALKEPVYVREASEADRELLIALR